jgi:hypothetical protein
VQRYSGILRDQVTYLITEKLAKSLHGDQHREEGTRHMNIISEASRVGRLPQDRAHAPESAEDLDKHDYQ